MQHQRNRAFDTAMDRWTSRDPDRAGGDPNPYRYVGNKPIRLVDPHGLKLQTAEVSPAHVPSQPLGIPPGGGYGSGADKRRAALETRRRSQP